MSDKKKQKSMNEERRKVLKTIGFAAGLTALQSILPLLEGIVSESDLQAGVCCYSNCYSNCYGDRGRR